MRSKLFARSTSLSKSGAYDAANPAFSPARIGRAGVVVAVVVGVVVVVVVVRRGVASTRRDGEGAGTHPAVTARTATAPSQRQRDLNMERAPWIDLPLCASARGIGT
jgi:hypothetical protein